MSESVSGWEKIASHALAQGVFVIISFVFALSACREAAETGVPKLIKQLQSKDAHQRSVAARALADYGLEASDAVRPLINTLWDDNIGVRSSAAYALTQIGTPEAKKAIEHYKKEKEKLSR